DNGDAGGEDIASSLTTSESDQAGTCTGAGIEILVVIRYAGCGGVLNGSVSSADGAWSAAVEATTTELYELGAPPPPPPHRPRSPYHHTHHPLMTLPRHRRHLFHRWDNQQDPPQGPRRHRPLDALQDRTLEHTQVTRQQVKHPQHTVDPQQQSHHQHALGLGHNLARVVPALAPQGQVCNLERVGPEERPLLMGPLASQVTQGARDHWLSVIL
nr:hypothetical protein [Tanacetum cinerariifolium]